MLAMSASLLSNANEGSSFIPKKEIITINDVKEGQSLIIKDLNGVILYKESIKESGLYSKAFDLTNLPDGSYFFEHEKDLEIKTIPFNVKSNKVTFEKEKETIIYKPHIRVKNNYVFINKLALDKEPLDVKIYSEDNQLIYSEKITNTITIEKAYKLSSNESYRMVLRSNGREYYKNITL